MLAIYRPDLSYRGDRLAQDMPKMRYVSVVMMRLVPARDADFAEVVRLVKGAYEKTGSDQPLIVYQLVSGAPGPCYLFLSPMVSLKTMDDSPARGRAMREALGEDTAAKTLKTSAEVTASSESFLFRLEPETELRLEGFRRHRSRISGLPKPPKPPAPPAATPTPAPAAPAPVSRP